ncbi:L-piperidine-6-carboxylate dehydrogenase [Aureibacter tunicatorum]|uniref:aldehyde dehydrogenase (NAD(+)) n=1 Tax=Aureibacter tunicatorum TaxID=866807 RepID=A0AAE3XL98_9BACT|nr:aldehyde dehydrogenase family protein [Aureibacter tunicatorum]MDR6237034.1 aldehyde dehydrogenase (NAD+) [Aureibacter tunicatorum]BDD06026.1 aldehyde dehydrogenase [Aureibacter tunicatorum]
MQDFDVKAILKSLSIEGEFLPASTGKKWFGEKKDKIVSYSPVDGMEIGHVFQASEEDYEAVIAEAESAFKKWRLVPAPKRGEIIRQIGLKLREHKDALGKLVSYEMGKSLQEGLGEVQEMIDIADFAVGLSRQLYGLTMHSERESHRMYEQYHPLGIVGIISAFNFPVAVWSWNSFLAWVCGDVCVWKPSEKTPLSAVACQKLVQEVFAENNLPEGLSCLIQGDYKIGELISNDKRIPLVSATGSTRMGKKVGAAVGARLGKSLLELGGNNAMIVSQDANLDIALLSAVFGAVGTAGQRCTSTRRLIVHESIAETVKEKISQAYAQLKIGTPLDADNHVGPLIDLQAVDAYNKAIEQAKQEGAKVIVEGGVLEGEGFESGCYVKPAVYEVKNSYEIVQSETFAPILYVMTYSDIEEAVDMQNDVPQGLSSTIVTNNLMESELFLSHAGSDCGIANVNIGTSGAEIGGAFGGEKETGGGRESGSDAWKIYMRRQTNTINFGKTLPLAQGIKFDF